MKILHKLPLILMAAFLLTGCVREDYFAYSNKADVLNVRIENQSGTAQVDKVAHALHIDVTNGTNMAKLVVKELEISPFATASIKVGDALDFSQTAHANISITAENGDTTVWKLTVFELGSQPQIDNSGFNIWYSVGSGDSKFYDLGMSDESSAWGTPNPGVAAFIGATVERLEVGVGDYAAQMTTRFFGLGAMMGMPIAAGSVFTGDFGDLNLANPQAAVQFGTPFAGMPISFTIDYSYTPGEKNINVSQDELPFPDTGDMYILLERREGEEGNESIKRVATAWYRIKEAKAEMQTITVDFVYGELPAGTPEYMLPKEGESYAEADLAPTHIVAVFTSSAYGNDYQGADGSVLIIDNLLLNY